MRTNIDINDDLMASAMATGEFTTKKQAVEEGLKLLARRVAYQKIRALRGKITWSLDGDWTKPEAPAKEKSKTKPTKKAASPS